MMSVLGILTNPTTIHITVRRATTKAKIVTRRPKNWVKYVPYSRCTVK
jgi:hypothetical protein